MHPDARPYPGVLCSQSNRWGAALVAILSDSNRVGAVHHMHDIYDLPMMHDFRHGVNCDGNYDVRKRTSELRRELVFIVSHTRSDECGLQTFTTTVVADHTTGNQRLACVTTIPLTLKLLFGLSGLDGLK